MLEISTGFGNSAMRNVGDCTAEVNPLGRSPKLNRYRLYPELLYERTESGV